MDRREITRHTQAESSSEYHHGPDEFIVRAVCLRESSLPYGHWLRSAFRRLRLETHSHPRHRSVGVPPAVHNTGSRPSRPLSSFLLPANASGPPLPPLPLGEGRVRAALPLPSAPRGKAGVRAALLLPSAPRERAGMGAALLLPSAPRGKAGMGAALLLPSAPRGKAGMGAALPLPSAPRGKAGMGAQSSPPWERAGVRAALLLPSALRGKAGMGAALLLPPAPRGKAGMGALLSPSEEGSVRAVFSPLSSLLSTLSPLRRPSPMRTTMWP